MEGQQSKSPSVSIALAFLIYSFERNIEVGIHVQLSKRRDNHRGVHIEVESRKWGAEGPAREGLRFEPRAQLSDSINPSDAKINLTDLSQTY